MILFVDACAIVAILSEEPDAEAYADAIVAVSGRPTGDQAVLVTSPMAAWEAILILSQPRKLGLPLQRASDFVIAWLDAQGIVIEQAPGEAADLLRHAVTAASHGVSRRGLSSFDCFHHAHATARGAAILTRDQALRDTGIAVLPAG